jgi:hypothetical protein
VLIAKPKVLPKDIASAKEFVEGGGEAMLKGLSAEEVLFFLSKRGRDESQYQRAVTLEGKARWEEEQR